MTMPLLLDVALKGSVLVALAAAGAAVARRSTAAHRHYLWTLALGGLLALPALSLGIPWRLPVVPMLTQAEPQPVAMPASAAIRERNAETARLVEAATMRAETSVRNAERAAASAATADARAVDESFAAAAEPVARRAIDLAAALRTLWIVGVALALGRLLVGVGALRWVLRDAREVSDRSWLELLASACERLDIRAPVRLLESPHANMPMAFGLLRPVVLLPMESDAWSPELREVVLLHELAHVRRRDVRANLVGQLACALYWFNPLVWTAARKLRIEAERACDDLVLGAGAPASAYAGHLLEMVQAAASMRAPALAVPMAQPSAFEGRVLAILDPQVARHGVTRRAAALGMLVLFAVTLPLAALAPAQNSERHRERLRQREVSHNDAEAGKHLAAIERGEVRQRLRQELNTQVTQRVQAQVEAQVAHEMHVALGNLDIASGHRDAQRQAPNPQITAGLLVSLQDSDEQVRVLAAHALAEREDTAAVNALLVALARDASKEVRQAAARALGEIEDARAVNGLVAAMRGERDREVRLAIVWALGEIESDTAVPGLGALLPSEDDKEIRTMIVWALGEIESAAAVPFLQVVLRDPDAEIREKAVWALGEIESAEATASLVALFSTERVPAVRSMIVWAVGEIEDPRGAPVLERALTDDNLEVRRKAIWAYGELDGLRSAPPALIAALRDSDVEVRRAAVHALGEIQDAAAVPGLIAAMRDSDLDVRRGVIHALGEIPGSVSVEALVAALRDPDPEIRRMAARALGDR